jgi:hypothetical protein
MGKCSFNGNGHPKKEMEMQLVIDCPKPPGGRVGGGAKESNESRSMLNWLTGQWPA